MCIVKQWLIFLRRWMMIHKQNLGSYATYEQMQEALNKIKSRLPKEKWKDISFVVETRCDHETDYVATASIVLWWRD